MARIETTRWVPDPENSNKLISAGQRSVQEIFQELKSHLASLGYTPDEYLLLNNHWSDGALFPEDGYIVQTVDYGGSEGIYLDAAIRWVDENNERQTENFFTGKTLGETDEDMNRMHLIGAAVTAAFYGDGVHARYIKVGGPDEKQNGLTIHLNDGEIDETAKALLKLRTAQKMDGEPYEQSEHILRRLVGSITEYMQFVGEKPLHMDAYDTAELAIRESNLEVFNEVYPTIPDKWPQLLVKAASMPGRVGSEMTDLILMNAKDFPHQLYQQACEGSIMTADYSRTEKLLLEAQQHIDPAEYSPRLFGEVAYRAYTALTERFSGKDTARKLLNAAPPEELKAVRPDMVVLAIDNRDLYLALHLVRGGIDTGPYIGNMLYAAAATRDCQWLVESFIEAGMDIDGNEHAALRKCFNLNNLGAAKVLIDNGADYAGFRETVKSKHLDFADQEFLKSAGSYFETVQQAAEQKQLESQGQPGSPAQDL